MSAHTQKARKPNANEQRDRETGRYTDGLKSICRRCGRAKGEHLAVPPHSFDEVNCDGFRKSRSA
jgi:hypothetical protein